MFSAVITAFIIESYKNLQQQPEDLTNQILIQLSAQIASLSLNNNLINSTVPSFTTPTFQKPQYTILLNTLWLLSLVISLITASLGILIKQWLHELLSYDTHDPKERLKLRFFREAGLERWKIFALASALPLLLQIALLLFLIGLGFFLHQQDSIVAWVTTGVMIPWLVTFLLTVSLQLFALQCPYKLPLLKTLSRGGYWARRESTSGLYTLLDWVRDRTSNGSVFGRFLELTRGRLKGAIESLDAFDEDRIPEYPIWDISVILYARDVLRGEHLSDSIAECFRDIADEDAKVTSGNLLDNYPPMEDNTLAGVVDGPVRAVHDFTMKVLDTNHLRSSFFHRGANLRLLVALYRGLSSAQYKRYKQRFGVVIQPHSLPLYISLIKTNPTSAAFAFLAMYSIRHRTLTDHPESFDSLFSWPSYSERLSHGIGKLTIS